MSLQTVRSTNSSEAGRLVAATFIALGISMVATVANSQQVIPFGDAPATADFSEAEIAARGQQKLPNLTYSTWKKLCFRVHRVQTQKWSAARPLKASPT
jgi:hypothetical protein